MITFEEYKSAVKSLPFGKRVGQNIYILSDDLTNASPFLYKFISPLGNTGSNILIKFFLDQFKISFLEYPDFFKNPHPALSKSTTLDLNTGKKREIDYSKHDNPPILHRKETMISPEREEFSVWKKLTEKLEMYNCFEDAKKIGFKQFWDKRLQEKGLYYVGQELKTQNPVLAGKKENYEV